MIVIIVAPYFMIKFPLIVFWISLIPEWLIVVIQVFYLIDMRTVNSQILKLPDEQLKWLLSVKRLFNTTFYNKSIDIKELIEAIENKAIERGFSEIGLLLDTKDLEEYFKSWDMGMFYLLSQNGYLLLTLYISNTPCLKWFEVEVVQRITIKTPNIRSYIILTS